MEDVFTLVVIAFIVLSRLGGLLTKGGKNAPGQRPRPVPAPGDDWGEDDVREPVAVASDVEGDREEERAAAEMIPDDLWEILTGERRRPQPSSGPDPLDAGYDDEDAEPGYAYAEAATLEAPVVHEPPIVVSMETPPPPPEVRHRQFHERIDELTARREARLRAEREVGRLSGRRSLRRAMVLREVLGPPKALE